MIDMPQQDWNPRFNAVLRDQRNRGGWAPHWLEYS